MCEIEGEGEGERERERKRERAGSPAAGDQRLFVSKDDE